ncbi:MAG: family 1 extracellular solute-binding protein [Paenibacillaceae bacterium]|nr:family 1 extracellular solute-binding protein [Paenibacillaceae bacterium]
MLKKFLPILFALVLISAMLAGCSFRSGATEGSSKSVVPGQGQSTKEGSLVKTEMKPITLRMFQCCQGITDDQFQNLIAGPVKGKFPNITIELVPQSKDVTAESLIAANDFPDLIYTNYTEVPYFKELGLGFDLTDFIKKNNFDLNLFDPIATDAIKSFSDKGTTMAIPWSIGVGTLFFYNKDIFDKFGVTYPKDGMTWEDAIELGRKVSAPVDGISYQALFPSALIGFASSLGPTYIDPQTGFAKITTDKWKTAFDLLKRIDEIPGNHNLKNTGDLFFKDRTLAMNAAGGTGALANLQEIHDAGDNFNWDLVALPNFKEAPGIGARLGMAILMISSTSTMKEEAFQVMRYLSSEEVQRKAAMNGKRASLRDPELQKVYGKDFSSLNGKHVSSIFYNKYAPQYPYTEYNDIVTKQLNAAINNVITKQVDANTALREAEEAANRAIAAEKGK